MVTGNKLLGLQVKFIDPCKTTLKATCVFCEDEKKFILGNIQVMVHLVRVQCYSMLIYFLLGFIWQIKE
jgi:hypothetical protein